MTQKIQQKKYEIMRWFWDIVFLQLQQLAQVCNENVLVGTDVLESPLNCYLLIINNILKKLLQEI